MQPDFVRDAQEEIDYHKNRVEENLKESGAVTKKLQDKIKALEQDLAKKMKKEDDKNDHIIELKNETKQLKGENTTLSKEVHEYQQRSQDLEKKLHQTSKNLENSNTQYTRMKKERREVAQQVTRLEKDVLTAKKKIEELTEQNTDLETKNKTHEQFIEEEFGEDELMSRSQLQK